jgi:hypothetical protein
MNFRETVEFATLGPPYRLIQTYKLIGPAASSCGASCKNLDSSLYFSRQPAFVAGLGVDQLACGRVQVQPRIGPIHCPGRDGAIPKNWAIPDKYLESGYKKIKYNDLC